MKVGFVGLGMMGNPMAQNLLKAGHGLTVFDVNPEATQQCRELGATVAVSLSEVGQCDLVFIIVNTAAQLDQVLFGQQALIDSREKGRGQTLVVMSTVSPKTVTEALGRIGDGDVRLVDAPVSGGPIVAEMGQLSFMIGGADSETMAILQPYLDVMGKESFPIGDLGSGLAVKLINNVVALGNAYVFTEALGIGAEAGLDIGRIVQVMSASSGSNWCTDNWDIYKAFMSLLLTQPSFQLTAEKDIDTAIEWAQELGLEMPSLRHVRSIIRSSVGITDKLQVELFPMEV